MEIWLILLFATLAITAVVALIALICYRMAFYNPKAKKVDPEKIDIPDGEIYELFRPQMTDWVRWTRSLPCEKMEITSHDGLTLRGKFYEYAPGAPMELMFHGYRGNAERDLSGGVARCFALGRSVLMVDQRSCGESDGKTITFGICEHLDCLRWVDFAVRRFGADCKIILTGISMGASTVLMAAGNQLPPNVIGVLADCGFTSAREIMTQVIGQMGLPATLVYPFVKLGAKLYGGFDLEQFSALEAAAKIQVPVILFHGEADDFVPCWMSRKLYDACKSRKKLVTVPNAGHGLAFPVDQKAYLEVLGDFFGPEASQKEPEFSKSE